jgi:guanylate kinase
MDYCVRVIQIDPTHRAALQIMAEVTDELQRESAEAARKLRSQRYEEGRQALAEEKWQAAIAAFEDVIAGDPDFQDVQKLLTRAQISDYEHRGITSPAESRVRVITITGPSGAGKSTTVQYLLALADRNFRPALVPKYTTRSPRDDDRGEVICADAIPEECDLVYELYAVRYGLQLSTVFDLIMKGLSPVIILNDIRAVEDVRNSWRGLVRSVFIYREVPSLAKYRALVEKRGVKNEMESMLRYQKAQAIYRLYIENIHLFDHVILNSGSFEDLEAQVKQIVKGLRQDLNWPLRRRR